MSIRSKHKKLKTRLHSGIQRSSINTRGSGLIEVCVGLIFLVTISLAALDIGVVVLGGDQAGALAKQAAHAAGNAATKADALKAVTDVENHFKPTNMYKSIKVDMDRYDGTYNGTVHVNCAMTLNLPVSLPIVHVAPTFLIKTQATAPILGIAPPAPG